MSAFNSFFDSYLQQYNTLTLSVSCIVMIVCILLSILTIYSLHHVLFETEDLSIIIKIFTILCAISFLFYIYSIMVSMIFCQLKMDKPYTYSIGISYIFMVFGKQSMYLLFLQTLIKTFHESKFQISNKLYRFLMSLIILNFLLYMCTIYFWLQLHDVKCAKYLIIFSIPIEIFYGLFIIILFCRNLFKLNIARVDQHKQRQYSKKVRSVTRDLVDDHKNKLKMKRSLSVPTPLPPDQDNEPTKRDSFTKHLSRISVSFPDIKILPMTKNQSADAITTPSLRQSKSLNITKFNKKHKELLDAHQLSVIDTAAKYAVLCCVALPTSLLLTLLIDGTAAHHSLEHMNMHFMIGLITVFNAFISDICVLLRYNDKRLNRLYGILCCGCSVCCKHCFLYCSIRRVMNKIEDILAVKVNEEIDAEISQITLQTMVIKMPQIGDEITKHNASVELNKKSNLEKLQSCSGNSPHSSNLSVSPTPNTPSNKTPTPSSEDLDEAAPKSYGSPSDLISIIVEDLADDELPKQGTKLSITVTSPDNLETRCTFNKSITETLHDYDGDQDEKGDDDDDDDDSTASEDMDKDIVFL